MSNTAFRDGCSTSDQSVTTTARLRNGRARFFSHTCVRVGVMLPAWLVVAARNSTTIDREIADAPPVIVKADAAMLALAFCTTWDQVMPWSSPSVVEVSPISVVPAGGAEL